MLRHITQMSTEDYQEVGVWLSTGIIFSAKSASVAANAILRDQLENCETCAKVSTNFY
jgi:hypothetical protein